MPSTELRMLRLSPELREKKKEEEDCFREAFRDLPGPGREEDSAHSAARTQLCARNQGPLTLPLRGTQNWRAKM